MFGSFGCGVGHAGGGLMEILLACGRWGGLESDAMQPGRPFLRSLQVAFLRHIKGKVHAEDGSFRSRLRSPQCVRAEGDDSDSRAAPLERSDIVGRVLAAVKSCSGVESSKVRRPFLVLSAKLTHTLLLLRGLNQHPGFTFALSDIFCLESSCVSSTS